MTSLQEKIANLIIEADRDIQNNNISAGLQKFEIAKQLARDINWEERVGTITSLINEVKQKEQLKKEHELKLKKIEQKKQENEEKTSQLIAARQQTLDKKKLEKQKKIEDLRKKKELADKISNEAYNLLEKGSKALLQNDFDLVLDSFKKALELFKSVNWPAEVKRVHELINDAQTKYLSFKQKQKNEKKQAEAIMKEKLYTQKQIKFREKLLEKERIAQKANVMELKRKSELIKEQENKAYLLIDEGNKNIQANKFDLAIKIFKEAQEIFWNIGWKKEANELTEEIKLSFKKKVKFEFDKKKFEERVIKKQKEKGEIELKAKISRLEIDRKKKEEQEKRQKELELNTQKELQMNEILKKISKIEKVIEIYEKEVDLGKILISECPYSEAIKIYRNGSQKLKEIGYLKESNNLAEGIQTYQQKLSYDKRNRELAKEAIEKKRREQEEIDRLALASHVLEKEREKEKQAKSQKEWEISQQKQAELNTVLKEINKIEETIKFYEDEIGLGYSKTPECPYPEAIKIYRNGSQKLKEIGYLRESNNLAEGIQTYQKKLMDDKRNRELEKEVINKKRRELEEIERLTLASHILEKEKEREKHAKSQKERKISQQKQAELNTVLKEINKIEETIKIYEDEIGSGYLNAPECPYSEAIEIYRDGCQKLKEIGYLDESKQLAEGAQAYQKKLSDDRRNRELEKETIDKKQIEQIKLEEKIQKSIDIFAQQKSEEKAKKEEIEKKLQMKNAKGKIAFDLMDRGNRIAEDFRFDEAIDKFQDAMDIFDEINWLAEIDKVLLQISVFRDQKKKYELEKLDEKERKIQEQKYIKEIDELAKLSWEKKLSEQREKEEEERKQLEEKKNEEKLEFQRKIQEDKEIQKLKDEEILKKLQLEQEIALKHQNIYKECLELLENAQNLNIEHQYNSAIEIYNRVLLKYKEINYIEGIRITHETIDKIQNEWDDYRYKQDIKLKTLHEKEEKERELEILIQNSQEEKERLRLLEEQTKLKKQLERDKEIQIQNEIISILEIAGNFADDYQFGKAMEYYDKSLELFSKIKWNLKFKQVLAIIQEVKQKKEAYFKNQKLTEEKQTKDEKSQKEFKVFLAKQEATRLNAEEKIKKESEEQKIIRERKDAIQEKAVKYLELAEKSINIQKFYLGLHYFHYAFKNFSDINWIREAKAVKKRFLQVYALITNPLIDVNEMLKNSNLDVEYHISNSISLLLMARSRKDFLVAQTELKTIEEMVRNLKWDKTLKLLEDFNLVIENDRAEYLKEIERKKYAPTKEKAIKLMTRAIKDIKNLKYDNGISLGNKAKEIYIQMGIEKEARKVEQELLRWKLKAERFIKSHKKIEGEPKGGKTLLSKDERRNAIIEERKRRRREARKKILGE